MSFSVRGIGGVLLLVATGCGGTVVRPIAGDAGDDDRPSVVTPTDAGRDVVENTRDATTLPLDVVTPSRDVVTPVRDVVTVDRGIPTRDVPASPDAGVVAGSRCEDDIVCGALQCAFGNSPFCTGPCTPSTEADPGARARAEQNECGGGGTCLSFGTGGGDVEGLCLAGCRTGVTPSTCREGFVCTGQWLRQADGAPDDPGCFPFCTRDDQCEGGGACNVRSGQCDSDGFVPTRLPDGSPCDPTRTETRPGEDTPRNVQCRGLCFLVSATNRTQGICGSLLDLARTPACPDDPTRITPRNPMGDDQAVCVFRACNTNADCASPLRCVWPERMGAPATELPRRCSYATTAQPNGVTDAGVAPDA